MILSKRLQKVADMFDSCESMVDVGTDHGYIPIYLIENNICKFAIASDINRGPVEKARKNINMHNLQDKIQCRLGGGLNTVSLGEIQGAVFAGMGGHLIKDIMKEGKDKLKAFSFAILQPVQHPEVLRRYLYNNGFSILDEALCFDEDKYYEIIKVKWDGVPRYLQEIDYEIGPMLIKKKDALLKVFVQHKIDKNLKIISSLQEDNNNVVKRKEELLNKNAALKEILVCL